MNLESPALSEQEREGRDSKPALELKHKPWLDGWRGIAISVVLIGHLLPGIPGHPARFGVELFFVLSGRLMAELLFVNRQPLVYFLKRRVARVWPALYLFVFVMALTFSAPGPHYVGPKDVLAALTYTYNYVHVLSGGTLVLDHLWSLCVEEWAYLSLAILALVTRRWNLRISRIILTIAAVCAINGVIQTSLGLAHRDVYWRTDVRIASIFVACGLYLILRKRDSWGYVPIVAGLAGGLFHTYLIPDVVKYTLGTFLVAVSVATIDTAPQWAIRILSSRPLTLMGLWSYSIYLWQQPFTKLLHPWPLPIRVALIMAAALASFYCLEQPARRYLKRAWAKQPGRPQQPEPAILEGGPAL